MVRARAPVGAARGAPQRAAHAAQRRDRLGRRARLQQRAAVRRRELAVVGRGFAAAPYASTASACAAVSLSALPRLKYASAFSCWPGSASTSRNEAAAASGSSDWIDSP